ncbi:MAG: radical SAM protein [Candidatus Xenobiia bacterium LiM19]
MQNIPSRIYVDVTNACPLRCLHCCSGSGESYQDELTLAEIKGIVEQTAEMSIKNIVFSGGEPMLRADLFDILEYTRSKDLAITLLTSGVLIDRNAARSIAGLGIRVKISIDGVTDVSHDFLRGEGCFERTVEALMLLRSARVENRSVHFTAHRMNFDDMMKLPDFLPSVGIRNIVVGTIKPSGRAREHEPLLIPSVLYPYFKQKVNELSRCSSITIQTFTDRGWEGFGCPATCNKFGITAYGRATTCVFFEDRFLGGSIREHSLRELWEQYQAQDSMFIPNDHCSECPALPASGGGCRVRALHQYGDINERDPYCCALYEKKLFIDSYRYLCEEALQDDNAFF